MGKDAHMPQRQREKLVKNRVGYLFQKISIFSGGVLSDIATNYAIMKDLALGGPTYAYQLWKRVIEENLIKIDLDAQPDYRTIERHVERLKNEGYIQVVDSEPTHAGRKETYGLTDKGVTVIESFREVREHFVEYMNWGQPAEPEKGPGKPLKNETFELLSRLLRERPDFQPFVDRFLSDFSREMLNRRDFESLTNEEVAKLRLNTFYYQLLAKAQRVEAGDARAANYFLEMLKKDPETSKVFKEIKAQLRTVGQAQLRLAELL
jgi:DNA-binding PadR family transcriptional regulator